MLLSQPLVYLSLVIITTTLAAVPSDLLLDIDGRSIVVGSKHACVIAYKHGVDIGGKAVCWSGYKEDDEDGIYKAPDDLVFVQIDGAFSFDCGITVDQSLYCWGRNFIEEVQQIPGLYTQVTVDDFFACAILTDGRVNCWGASDVVAYVQKQSVGLKLLQISCADSHCCAIDENAHPHCFGQADAHAIHPPTADISMSGELAQEPDEEEDEENYEKSQQFQKLQFRQISVGPHYSCGVTVEGPDDIRCWGHKRYRLPRYLKGPFKQVSVSGGICAIRGVVTEEQSQELAKDDPLLAKSHSMRCWGNVMLPSDPNMEWDQVNLGPIVQCGVTMDSEVRCAGTRGIQKIPENLVVA